LIRLKTIGRYPEFIGFLLALTAFTVLAAQNGADASWDLRNYHLYNPFALLHGRLATDIAPAQRQTFIGPQLDLIYYGLRSLLNDEPIVLACILSIPHAIGAWLTWRIALHFIPDPVPSRTKLAVLAAAIGATGAAALPTLAQSGSDMVPACFCLAGFLLLLAAVPQTCGYRRIAGAGLLFGIAAGLKLTAAPFCVAAAAALLIAPAVSFRRRLSLAGVFALAVLVSLAVIAGPWCMMLYLKYRNPIFPLFNTIFRSPYYPPISVTDDRFRARDVVQAVFYPFYWATDSRPVVTETQMRDPRIAAAYVAVVVIICRSLIKRRLPDAKCRLLLVFCCVSYVLWALAFSIFRYLVPLELISAVMVLAAVTVSRRLSVPWIAICAFGSLALSLTVYPKWGHVRHGHQAVAVRVPPLRNDALVVMLDGSPMAYVAAFVPPGVRFVGANNNLIQPEHDSLLQHEVVAAIRAAAGPVWGLEDAPESPGVADATLAAYGLRRAPGCEKVQSNLDGNALLLCPLLRVK
jgi:hypothetical protein